jgi:type IV secretion system protein VirB9
MRDNPLRKVVPALLISSLGACATSAAVPPANHAPPEIAATRAPEPGPAVRIVEIPRPLPLPGQLKPVGNGASPPEPSDPRRRVGAANDAARVQPVRDGFLNAIQQYPYTDGALY